MYGHGKVEATSNFLQSSADKFGVTWGEELRARERDGDKSNNITQYASFFLEGKKYCLYDTIYLQSADGPAYVARIAGLCEKRDEQDGGTEKHMLVRWFCRPSELPAGLRDVDYSESCKHVFMLYGKGATNRCNPASTISKCTVLCTAPDQWNTGHPSDEKIAAADHTFDRAFDLRKQELRSLDFLVKELGSVFVTGLGGQSNKTKINGGVRRTFHIVKKPVENGIKRDDRGLLPPMTSSVDTPKLNGEPQPSKRTKLNGEPQPSKRTKLNGEPQPSKRIVVSDLPLVAKHAARPPLAQKPGIVKQIVKNSVPVGRNLSASNQGLTRKLKEVPLPNSSVKGKERIPDHLGKPVTLSGDKSMRMPSRPGTEGFNRDKSSVRIEKCRPPSGELVLKAEQRKPEQRQVEAIMKKPSLVRNHPVIGATSGSGGMDLSEPKKKIFNFPWHSTIGPALEQKRVLLLQNLDPWFTSSEIEAMLQELLHVSCDVRMLPPKDFSSYTSGEALVLFRTLDAATRSLKVFDENLVLWSNDDRPVLAKVARQRPSRTSYFHGYFNPDKIALRIEKDIDKENAVATSHCSQPNTAEYEMGVQWRWLQDRHTEAWRIAHKVLEP